MKYNEDKIYVCTNLYGGENVQILIQTNNQGELQWSDFHQFITSPLKSLNEYHQTDRDVIYILDDIYDLANFINGKRDFPIFKTDEEEQREKEEAEKSQECNNREDKLKKLRDVIDNLFDENLEKEGSCVGAYICKGHDCSDNDYDCRNCFMNYIQRIVA